jgi:hypothetical protein
MSATILPFIPRLAATINDPQRSLIETAQELLASPLNDDDVDAWLVRLDLWEGQTAS